MKAQVKKWLALTAVFIIAAACSLAVAACKEKPKPDEPVTVVLNLKEMLLDRYETGLLEAAVTGSTAAVTWASSKPDVASVNGGLVEAKGVGTAEITAAAGDVKASCAVTVADSGERPILIADVSDKTMTEGETYDWNVRARYKYADIDAVLTFVSAAPAVVGVSNAGIIEAKPFSSPLPVNVTVSGEWRGYNLEPQVKGIKVIENAALTLSLSQVELATSAPDGTDYETSKTFDITAVLRGVTQGSPDITVVSGNDLIATGAYAGGTGTITAVGRGETVITFTYTTPNGSVFKKEVEAGVIIPIVDDAAGDYNFVLDISKTTVSADFAALGLNGVMEVWDFDANVNLNVSASGSNTVFDETKLVIGERSFIVYTSAVAYRTEGIVANMLINNESEFIAFDELMRVNGHANTEGKYYLLMKNLDFTSIAGNQITDNARVFSGIFNGNGFTIKGIEVPRRGLFGNTLYGTVKNLAVLGARITNTGTVTFIANTAEPSAVIQNIVVQGTVAAVTGQFGGIANIKANGSTISNCVIIADVSAATGTGNDSAGVIARDARGFISDIIAVSPTGKPNWVIAGTNHSSARILRVADAAEFGATVTSLPSANGWGKYWTLDTENEKLCFGGNVVLKWGVISMVDRDDLAFNLDMSPGTVTATLDAALTGITSIIDEQTDDEVLDSATGNIVTFKNLTVGERKFVIYLADAIYRTDVIVATQFITNKTEFNAFVNMLIESGTATVGKYYLLTSDLDYTSDASAFTVNNLRVFRGVFNGDGHTIKEVPGTRRGFFGNNLYGTVKNIAFTDVRFLLSNASHVIANVMESGAVVSNVFISIKTVAPVDNVAPIANTVALGASVENCVVIADLSGVTATAKGAIINAHRGNLENIFVICPGCPATIPFWNTTSGTPTSANLVGLNDAAAFGAGVTSLPSANGWSSFWSFTGNTTAGSLKFGANTVLTWA